MYSPLYQYFEIRRDEKYSEAKPIKEIIEILQSTGVLTKFDDSSFRNQDNFPWIEISSVNASIGGYNSNIKSSNEKNLLTVVTSKKEANNKEMYINLLKIISKKLKWELVLEEDEVGNEQVIIYKP